MNKSLIEEVENNATFTTDLKAEAKNNAQQYFCGLFGDDKNVIVNFKG
jgi:hypothetical protein